MNSKRGVQSASGLGAIRLALLMSDGVQSMLGLVALRGESNGEERKWACKLGWCV